MTCLGKCLYAAIIPKCEYLLELLSLTRHSPPPPLCRQAFTGSSHSYFPNTFLSLLLSPSPLHGPILNCCVSRPPKGVLKVPRDFVHSWEKQRVSQKEGPVATFALWANWKKCRDPTDQTNVPSLPHLDSGLRGLSPSSLRMSMKFHTDTQLQKRGGRKKLIRALGTQWD